MNMNIFLFLLIVIVVVSVCSGLGSFVACAMYLLKKSDEGNEHGN